MNNELKTKIANGNWHITEDQFNELVSAMQALSHTVQSLTRDNKSLSYQRLMAISVSLVFSHYLPITPFPLP